MAIEETVRTDAVLTDKGSLVEALWHAVDHAAGNLEAVPGLVRRIIESGAWRSRVHKGKTYEHARFIDFITTKPLAGCGWAPEKVEALIKDDAVTLALWRDTVTAPAHRPTKTSDIVTTLDGDGRGNSLPYTLSRLKRERPDLFEQVAEKKLSANAAAIEAGFRKKQTPLDRLRKAWTAASSDDRQTFCAENGLVPK